MSTVSIVVRKEVADRLQKLALLAGDVSSVIERLINHWEGSPLEVKQSPPQPQIGQQPKVWRSTRGEEVIVGTKLRKEYLGTMYTAEVTEGGIALTGQHRNGEMYASPSKAAVAVKELAGKDSETGASSTNGWDFWEMLSPGTAKWVSLNVVREAQTRRHRTDIDLEAVLAAFGPITGSPEKAAGPKEAAP